MSNFQSSLFDSLVTKDDLDRLEHQSGSIHFIGEALEAPSVVSVGTEGGSVGVSPLVAREDHSHPFSSSERLIFSTTTTRDAWTGTKVAGMLCYVADTDLEYIWTGSAWKRWTGPLVANQFTWTPTLSDLTLGNGSVVAYYTLHSGMCFIEFQFSFGTTSSIAAAGSPRFTLPFAMYNASPAFFGDIPFEAGMEIMYFDATGGRTPGKSYKSGDSTIGLLVDNTSGTYAVEVAPTSTVPFTFTTNDKIWVSGWYRPYGL